MWVKTTAVQHTITKPKAKLVFDGSNRTSQIKKIVKKHVQFINVKKYKMLWFLAQRDS